MNAAPRLRTRLLQALAASGLAAAVTAQVGCGTTVTIPGSSGGGGSGSTSTTSTGTGTGATGGTMSTGATGGGGSNQNCFTDEIGTCCYYNPCYTLDELKQFTLDGMVPTECPPYTSLTTNDFCSWFSAGPTVMGESCCYEMGSGDCCGRPFTISGKARHAEVGRRATSGDRSRADWAFAMEPVDALDDVTRAALSRAWLADAQMEHASIASFARFTLHLLAFGAPPSLLSGAQQAASDEIEHARACFALAGRYAGEAVGPGAMAMAGALENVRLAEAAAAAVREGCVGETIAAAIAGEQLSISEDGEVRRALSRIARDEEAHAELSWRFVKWAIEEGGEPVRAAVAQAFSEMLSPENRKVSIVTETVDIGAWHLHGRLTHAEMERAKAVVIREVILPCAEVLLGGAVVREAPVVA